MPPPLEEDEEIKIQNLKRDLISVADGYIKETNAKGSKYLNLTESESRGLESLKKRKDVVIFQTDKSGRMAVDTKDNYIEATLPHVAGDDVVDDKAHT